MDKDYGFYDYTGTGDYIEGALGGYQYDEITRPRHAMAEGQGPADDRPQAALVPRGQPRQSARRDVAQHRLPGQPVQAKDAQLGIAFAPNDTLYQQEWNSLPLQNTWQQPLDAPGRVPAHRIYHEANGY